MVTRADRTMMHHIELSENDVCWLVVAIHNELERMTADPDMPPESIERGQRLWDLLQELPLAELESDFEPYEAGSRTMAWVERLTSGRYRIR